MVGIIREFGLGIGMSVAILVMFFFLLKWVLKQQETILKDAKEERAIWQTITKGFQDAIHDHTASAKAFHEEVKEAHRFQREEHKEMITVLGRINGYKT